MPKFILNPSLKKLLPQWPLEIYRMLDNISWARSPVARAVSAAEEKLRKFGDLHLWICRRGIVEFWHISRLVFRKSFFLSLHYQPNMCHFNEDWRGWNRVEPLGQIWKNLKKPKVLNSSNLPVKILDMCCCCCWLLTLVICILTNAFAHSIDLIVFWLIGFGPVQHLTFYNFFWDRIIQFLRILSGS